MAGELGGFLFLKNEKPELNPLQGKVVVPVVDAFPGHIAYDSASRSEVVVPLLSNVKVWGVLDVEGPEAGRITDEDARGLEAIVESVNASYQGARTI